MDVLVNTDIESVDDASGGDIEPSMPDSSVKSEGDSSSKGNRSGRKRCLSDAEHRGRQAHLHAALAENWFEIAWALETMKSYQDVPEAFRKVYNSADVPVLDLLKTPLTPSEVSEVKALIGDIDTPVRDVANRLQQMRESIEDSRRKKIAIDSTILKLNNSIIEIDSRVNRGTSMRSDLRNILISQRDQVITAIKQFEEKKERLSKESTPELLQWCEAYFAQTQLFTFCESGQYELNPLNLANALASVPFTSCRISARTSVRLKLHQSGQSLSYALFRLVRKLADSFNKIDSSVTLETVEDTVRAWLDDSDESPASNYLRKNVRQLVRAVFSVMKHNLPAASRPYVIGQRFTRLVKHPTPDEVFSMGIDDLLESL